MTNLVKALSPINGNAQHFELSGSSESIILLLARNNEETIYTTTSSSYQSPFIATSTVSQVSSRVIVQTLNQSG